MMDSGYWFRGMCYRIHIMPSTLMLGIVEGHCHAWVVRQRFGFHSLRYSWAPQGNGEMNPSGSLSATALPLTGAYLPAFNYHWLVSVSLSLDEVPQVGLLIRHSSVNICEAALLMENSKSASTPEKSYWRFISNKNLLSPRDSIWVTITAVLWLRNGHCWSSLVFFIVRQ